MYPVGRETINDSKMNFVGVFLTICIFFLVLFGSKRVAALALLSIALFVTQGEFLNISGIHMPAVRFVSVIAFLRCIFKKELFAVKLVSFDKWLLIFFSTFEIVTNFRSGNFDTYLFGSFVDALIVYFSFRALFSPSEDLFFFVKGAAVLLVPIAFLMLIEANTGTNYFSAMGGVLETPILRDGHYRCQGPFRHAIMAGSVGASFLSLFGGLLFYAPCRLWGAIGVGASIAIVGTSHSSGPLLAALVGVIGWCTWKFRFNMRPVRWSLVGLLIALQLAMNAPVWFIFDRLSGYIGGDGWHRSNLIDQFIKHFANWWLIGMPIEETGDWAATRMPWGGVDVTNYYISIGLGGGLITLIIYLLLLRRFSRMAGNALDVLRSNKTSEQRGTLLLVFGATCMIWSHLVNLSGVIYWDQTYLVWYLHLALTISLFQQVYDGRVTQKITTPHLI